MVIDLKINYEIDEDEDLLLAELEAALKNELPDDTEELPEDIDVEDLGMDDDVLLLEQEAKRALERDFEERSKHFASMVQKDGAIVYQSGSRKDIDIERFLTKEEKDEYTQKNLNLVHHMAHKYYSNHSLLDEYEEFYGEALLGFTKALNTYDLGNTVPFSNYACFCMDNALRTYCGRLSKMSQPDIAMSFDDPVTVGPSADVVGDLYVDSEQESVHDIVVNKMDEEDLLEELSQIDKLLTPTQMFIVSTFYGINGCSKMNKTQISKTLHLPMSKLNQELKDAMERMRNNNRLCNIYS